MKGFHNITREYKKLDYKLMLENEMTKTKISEVKNSTPHLHWSIIINIVRPEKLQKIELKDKSYDVLKYKVW